jgi:4-hydroxybenzoate polyprenyltransferase
VTDTLRPSPLMPPPSAPRRTSLPVALLEAMRPKQWIKNLFVLAGVIFSGQLTDASAVLQSLIVLVAFCLVSGSTYLINDALDAEKDRLNPRTMGRPIARGDLSVPAAVFASVATGLGGIALAWVTGWQAPAVLAGYLVLQLWYSKQLKHVLFIDVMVIAAGFTLRAYAGIVAIGVDASVWLLLCTSLLALLLALSKRRGEAVALDGERSPHRPVLDYYSVSLLDELISVITPTTVVVYALYTVQGADSDAMLLTLPFVLYGIFRLLFIMHHKAHVTDEPDQLVWKDYPLLACVVLWGVAAAVVTLAAS